LNKTITKDEQNEEELYLYRLCSL